MAVKIKCAGGVISIAKCKGAKNEYEVVGFGRRGESCIIPDNFKGKPIVGIASSAFKKCAALKDLFIPDSIRYIFDDAFVDCKALGRVRVPLGLVEPELGRLRFPASAEIFVGTQGLKEDEEPDDGGKSMDDGTPDEAPTPDVIVEIRKKVIPVKKRKPVIKREKRPPFRRLQALKTVVFFLPTLIAAIVPFDIFNSYSGHYLDIIADDSIGLDLAITLYVFYCIIAVTAGVLLTVFMYLNESRGYNGVVYDTKPYNIGAVVVGLVSLAIITANLWFIVPNLGKDKVTFGGGDVNVIEYVEKDGTLVMHEAVHKDDVYDNYFTKYVFKYWDIGGEHYPAGTEYNPEGWLRAEAVFELVECVNLKVATSGATVTVQYDGKSEDVKTDVLVLKRGTEVTISAGYDYSYSHYLEVNSNSVTNPYTFTIYSHSQVYAQSEMSSSSGGGCLVEGTLVTMADGSRKPVEDLKVGDELLVFNHSTGKLDTAPLFANIHALQPTAEYDVVSLSFSGGESLSIVDEHAVFDVTEGRYAYITKDNAESYIGHVFAGISGGEVVKTTLTGVEITKQFTRIYNPVSNYHVNLVAGELLTNSAYTIDMFEYDEDMSYNDEAMAADIAKYGVFEYETFAPYVSREEYESFPICYYKVAVEKGLCTISDVMALVDFYLDGGTDK